MKMLDTLTAGLKMTLAGALMAVAAPVAGQNMPSDPGVAVFNDSPHEVRVWAYEGDLSDGVLLGWVGSSELEFFSVPSEVKSMDGEYRIAVQQVTPLPSLGEPVDHPVLSTPPVEPEPDETVRVTLTPDLELSVARVK